MITVEEMKKVIKDFELDEFENYSRAVNYGKFLYYKDRQPLDFKPTEKQIQNAYIEIENYKNKPFLPFIVAFDSETSIVDDKPTLITGQMTFNQTMINFMQNENQLYKKIFNEIDDTNTLLVYDLKDVIKILKLLPNNTLIPVHNLKYDYSYLVRAFLLDVDIEIDEIRTDIALYSVKITYDKKQIIFYDTAKQFPTSLRKIGDIIGFAKGETYYPLYFKDKKSIILSDNFIEYSRQDTRVLLKAVESTFLFNYLKNNGVYLTSGGFAYHKLKSKFKKHNFYDYFPKYDTRSEKQVELEFETYKGGLVYLNEFYKNKRLKNIDIYDGTSMYPDKMRNRKMAYGQPEIKYKNMSDVIAFLEKNKNLEKVNHAYFYFVTLRGTFSKDNIILLNSKEKAEYFEKFKEMKTTTGYFPEWFDLAVTDYELQQLLKFAENVEFKNTVKTIVTKKKIFPEIVEYMDEGFELKAKNSKGKGNEAMRAYAKLLINSPYGKFGTRRKLQSFESQLDENNEVQIVETEENFAGEYVLFASYVTGMARAQLISMIAEVEVYYTDTDSIHLDHEQAEILKAKIPELFDDYELGKFKHENFAIEGIYSQPKTYIEYIKNDKMNYHDVHCCGLNNIEHLTCDTFLDERIEIVLKSKTTSYGIVLKNQLVYVNYNTNKLSSYFKQQNRKVRRLQNKLDEEIKKIWLNCKTIEEYENADNLVQKCYNKIRSSKI